MKEKVKTILFSYDDVLIKPNYSAILPSETNLETNLTRNIKLNIPIVSAAMDTVTESRVAIVMAQEGGIGVIHKNLSAEDQAKEVKKVKKYEAGLIVDPITVTESTTIEQLYNLKEEFGVTGFPVTDNNGVLIGIVTNRDLRFESNSSLLAKDIMTGGSKLITGKDGISIDQAKLLLKENRIEKLPIIDSKGHVKGLITIKDIERSIRHPNAIKDSLGRLRVAGAMGVSDTEYDRAKLLAAQHIDCLIIDTAHGHSKGVIEMVKTIKKDFKDVDVIAGNVATKEACEDLIKAGVDGIKVGIGPGSICTTRVIAGIGVPQLSAVMDCADVCLDAKVPFIADGGIKYSGDIVKALAAGASCAMIGSLFAGASETPGKMVHYQGRSYKVYRGMGSLGAMVKGSKDRYGQGAVNELSKLVPEGVEGQVPYRGPLSSIIYQILGGLRSGMGYVGAETLELLRERANFVRVSYSSLKESHPHDIMITNEAPNYRIDND